METGYGTNGAERLCDALLTHEVDVCFANPGTSEMHFVGALDRRPQMRCVLGLFEGVVTAAADGYARMADKPAATLLHLGPGLANGLANLHNAKRARTPVINIVGDHATYHLRYDAPLASDIDALAAPMSNWLGRANDADGVAADATAAWRAAVSTPGVATLILPADVAWGQARNTPIAKATAAGRAPVDTDRLRMIAREIRKGGRTVLLVGGRALRADALPLVAAIAATAGVDFIAETFNARMERGAGRVAIAKLPYPIDLATQNLSGADRLVLIDAAPPVAFFAYPGKPSVLCEETCDIHTAVKHDEDVVQALEWLAGEFGVTSSSPAPSPSATAGTDLPRGPLTADAHARTVDYQRRIRDLGARLLQAKREHGGA